MPCVHKLFLFHRGVFTFFGSKTLKRIEVIATMYCPTTLEASFGLDYLRDTSLIVNSNTDQQIGNGENLFKLQGLTLTLYTLSLFSLLSYEMLILHHLAGEGRDFCPVTVVD